MAAAQLEKTGCFNGNITMTKTIHNRPNQPYRRMSQPKPRLIRGDFAKESSNNYSYGWKDPREMTTEELINDYNGREIED